MHQAEHDLAGFKSLGHPVDDPFAVFQLAGQDQMPDDDAAFQETVRIELVRTGLPVHFPDGFGSYPEVERRVAVFNG